MPTINRALSRVTITKKANGRYYIGMDANAAQAMVKMIRCAMASAWFTDCGGVEVPADIRNAGGRIFASIITLEKIL